MVKDAAAKEVGLYAEALKHGFDLAVKNQLLTINHIVEIQRLLGTKRCRNQKNTWNRPGKPSYWRSGLYAPQDYKTILHLMDNLLEYINQPALHDVEPLIKMAVIHYQFETIHPFYDGNGRTGRILNLLYLVMEDLLTLPILYLSRYIIRRRVIITGCCRMCGPLTMGALASLYVRCSEADISRNHCAY